MRKSLSLLFVVSALLGMVLVSPAFAASKKKAPPPGQHQTSVIASVTTDSITVTEGEATKTFTITQFTEINVNGQKAAVADLKPGMAVSITLTDLSRASRINATGK